MQLYCLLEHGFFIHAFAKLWQALRNLAFIMNLPNCHCQQNHTSEKMCVREHVRSSCSRLVSRRSNGIWEECFDKAVDGWLTWHARTPWLHKCHFSYPLRNADFDHLTLILPIFSRRRRKRRWCPRMKKELQTFSWSHWALQGDSTVLKDPHVHKKL